MTCWRAHRRADPQNATASIHRKALSSYDELNPSSQELLETGIKVIDLICPSPVRRLRVQQALAGRRE
jgi:F0F1-type ATP synthase beta subunit